MASLHGVSPGMGRLPGAPVAYSVSDEINRLVIAGQLDEAEGRTRAELRTTYSPPDLRTELLQKQAFILNKLGRMDEAEIAANEGLNLTNLTDMRIAMLKFELAISFSKRGDPNRALTIIDETLNLQDMTIHFRWELYALKIALLAQLNRFEEAEKHADFALRELEPISTIEKIKFLGMYANILNERKKYSAARDAATRALLLTLQEEMPDDFKADIYTEQARSYDMLGQRDSAVASLRAGLLLPQISNETYCHLTINLCKIYIQTQQFPAVIVSVEKVLARQAGVKPDSLGRLCDYKSLAHISHEQDLLGLEAAEKGLLIPGITDGTRVKLSCQKACALNNLKRFNEAIQTVDVCITIPHLENEYKVALLYFKIFALKETGKIDEARKLIEEGLQLPGVNPQTKQRLNSLR